MLTRTQLREALAKVNLSQLSRDTGVDLRKLRRFKNGQSDDIMASTAELLSTHLSQQPKPRGRK